MTTFTKEPEIFKSKWVYEGKDGTPKLRTGAPESVKKQFNSTMEKIVGTPQYAKKQTAGRKPTKSTKK